MKIVRKLSILLLVGAVLALYSGWQYPGKSIFYWSASGQTSDGGHQVFLPNVSSSRALSPLPTTSYYFFMKYYTPEKARSEGCKLGTRDHNLPGIQDSVVILDFGITKYKDGQYGASGMVLGGFYPLNTIAEAVEQFGIGYWDCTESDFDSHLRIGIGTNNYNNSDDFSYLSVTYGHGKAWAQMVNSVNDWFKNQCPSSCNGQVDAVGANDIEMAWSSPTAAIDWLKGYDSANLFPLFNFGAAEGCPDFCGGGGYYWTNEQAWTVQNSGPVYSIPEIYLNDGRNALQWYKMSLYSVAAHGFPYDFMGVMTTYGACLQYPEAACEYIDNTPEQGWTQLNTLVNGATPSTWDDIPYVTDIMWWE